MQTQFPRVDGAAQAGFQLQALGQGPHHFRREEGHGIAAVGLGAIHRRVGVLQQRVGRFAVARIDGDAQAGVDRQQLPADFHRLGQGAENLLRHRHDVGDFGHVAQHHDELVAAQARHGVALAHAFAQAVGHGPQQLVALAMAETVVHGLEAVEVEHQHASDAMGAPGVHQRLLEPVGQQVAIGQQGQRVDVGLVLERFRIAGDLDALPFERTGHAVECAHHLAEFAARIGRADARAVIAGIQARNGLHQARRLAPDGKFAEHGCHHEDQDGGHGQPEQRPPELAFDVLVEIGFRHADRQAQPGVALAGQEGPDPDVRVVVFADHRRVVRRGTEHEGFFGGADRERRRIWSRMVHDDRTIAVPYLEMHAREGQGRRDRLPVGIHVQRPQQHVAQRAVRRSHRIGDLQHALAGQPADRRLHDRAAGGKRLLEVLAIVQHQRATAIE